MTDSILYLLAILIVANVLLMGVAIARSMTRRRRATHGATVPPASTSRPMTSVANPPADSPVAAGPGRRRRSDPGRHPRRDGGAPDRRADRAAAAGRVEPRPHRRGGSDRPLRTAGDGRDRRARGLERLTGVLGPGAADRVLPALADVLGRHARGADYVARLGPGRFGILLPETGEVEAVNYVERVRRRASSGSNPARSRCAWPSAGPLHPWTAALRMPSCWPRTGCTPSFAAASGARPISRRRVRRRAVISGARPRRLETSPAMRTAGQSTPWRNARPGVAPVWTPSATTRVPATMTCSMPTG